MRIAIPFDNGNIAGQFEETGFFKLFNLEDGKIVSDVVIPSFGGDAGALAGYLRTVRADVLICGGIRAEARRLLAGAGVAVYPGMGGSADDAARAFASGSFHPGGCGHDHADCREHDCPFHADGGCQSCGH